MSRTLSILSHTRIPLSARCVASRAVLLRACHERQSDYPVHARDDAMGLWL